MSNKTLEQTIRLVMEQQANAGVLYYGSDLARDTYAKDTPGQTPGVDHSPEQHQHKPNLALDGVPVPGGQLKKPNFEKDAGMGKVAEAKENKMKCEHCDGTGKHEGKDCPKCEGKGYMEEAKDMKVKNCGCGKDPCETYGSKEEQMKAMNEMKSCPDGEYYCMKDKKCKPIPDGMKLDKDGMLVKEGAFKDIATKKAEDERLKKRKETHQSYQKGGKNDPRGMGSVLAMGEDKEEIEEAGRWETTSAGRAYRRLSPEEKARRAKAKMIQRRSQAMKGSNKTGKVGITKLKSVYKGRKRAVEEFIDDLHMAYVEEAMSPEERKKAAQKIFQMNQDKKANQALQKKSDPAAKAARRDAASYKTSDDSHLDKKPKAPEKKRGRGERDLPHIVSQMRSVVDNDKHPGVKFKDGKTKKVSQKQASAYLKKHDSAKPADKLNMYKAHDSHKSFMKHVGEAMKGMGDSAMTGMDPNDASKPDEAAKDRASARRLRKHDMKKGRDTSKTNYYDVEARKRYQQKFGQKFGEGMMDDIKDKVKASPLNMNTLSRKRAQVKVDLKKRLNKMEAVDDKDKKGLEKLAKGLKGSSQAHLDQMKKLKKMISDGYIAEKSVPNNPKLWAAKKAAAKAKFDVYPSAYANGWAAKAYKKAGGTWRSESVEHDLNELYPSHNTGTIDMDRNATPEQKKARADFAKKRAAFAKKYPNASTNELMHAKLSPKTKKEEVVNELSTRTLTNYIQKASNPGDGRSAINQASRGGYKLGQQPPGGDLSAGEKNDRKAFKRGKGIMRAAQKIQRKTYGNLTKPTPYGGSEMSPSLTRKTKKEEKMPGQEYRTQMSKVKSKDPAVRKAISNIYDKKPGKDINHPEVKAAKKYMKTEQTVNEISADLINRVRQKRSSNVVQAYRKYDDYRSPEYKDAVKKSKRNQMLTFRAGAKKAKKLGDALSKAYGPEGMKKKREQQKNT